MSGYPQTLSLKFDCFYCNTYMPAPLKRSGLQTEVIHFYRKCFKAAREKPLVNTMISNIECNRNHCFHYY
jgi:hypothetical protein